jgi:hypothetical protein
VLHTGTTNPSHYIEIHEELNCELLKPYTGNERINLVDTKSEHNQPATLPKSEWQSLRFTDDGIPVASEMKCKKCNTPVKTAMADLGVPVMSITAKYDPEVLNQIIKQVESEPIVVSKDGVMIGHITEAKIQGNKIVGVFNPVYPEVPDKHFVWHLKSYTTYYIEDETGMIVETKSFNNSSVMCDEAWEIAKQRGARSLTIMKDGEQWRGYCR